MHDTSKTLIVWGFWLQNKWSLYPKHTHNPLLSMRSFFTTDLNSRISTGVINNINNGCICFRFQVLSPDVVSAGSLCGWGA